MIPKEFPKGKTLKQLIEETQSPFINNTLNEIILGTVKEWLTQKRQEYNGFPTKESLKIIDELLEELNR